MHGSLSVRREVVRVCRRLYERGLIAGPDGNVSVRLPGDRVLVTPAGLSKVDDTWLYVSRGAGFWGPPVRVGAPPDITMIELRTAG